MVEPIHSPGLIVRLRRSRYAFIVVSLVSAVFVGVASVVGMLSATTFRPLPFTDPETLFQFSAGGNLWDADTLAATARLTAPLVTYATYQPQTTVEVRRGESSASAMSVATSPNFFA